MEVSKFKVENAKAIAITLVVIVALVLASYLICKTYGSISNFIGGIKDGVVSAFSENPLDSAQDTTIQQAAVAAASPGSPWSPSFYQNAPNGASLFTSAVGDALAKQIWDTVSWFQFGPPDSAAAEGAIKQCSTQSQVSFLADRFNKSYSKDLYTWLNQAFAKVLDSPNVYALTTINDYVNSLPQYN